MSGLRERLLRLKSSGQGSLQTKSTEHNENEMELPVSYQKFIEPVQEESVEEQVDLPMLDSLETTSKESDLPAGWRLLGAELVSNEWGSFILRRKVFSPSKFHGDYELRTIMECASALDAFQKEGKAIESHEQLLFFDTETTGLGVGAGNVPFLIGMGYYQGESIVMEQLFIRNASEERAMLQYFLERLTKCTHLVSYNGKSFDWPLVLNRLVLNRMVSDCPELHHIDLLHASRSVWKHTLPTCKLSTVEEDRLGVHRHDDVPGSLAPVLYFQYLAEGNPTLLSGIFDHNELDVLSLASLAIHFAQLLEGKVLSSAVPTEERFRCALWLEKMGRVDLANERMDELFQEIVLSCTETNRIWRSDVPIQLAAWYKKRGLFKHAVVLWQRLIDFRTDQFGILIEPFVELAMYYEHRERNLGRALDYAQTGEQMLRKRKVLNRRSGTDTTPLSELTHRINRLKRKMGGSSI
ncbi:ribonuclease H-like domain-containing protein [Paenibacillus sp. KN14-4R]|uniref:ribonuclease H-like domain-containing protein n=1 Tax=Paenibacillus sp. KN14-4R TaxID=3445773 RepID=UPI003FA010D0